MVTVSHNTPQKEGIKMMRENKEILRKVLKKTLEVLCIRKGMISSAVDRKGDSARRRNDEKINFRREEEWDKVRRGNERKSLRRQLEPNQL